jgi:hypothetical protein
VRLQSIDDHTRMFSGVTDNGGRFEVKGIEPGRYRLRVIRNGYTTQEYGQRSPNDAQRGAFHLFRQRSPTSTAASISAASRRATTNFSAGNKWSKTPGKIRIS